MPLKALGEKSALMSLMKNDSKETAQRALWEKEEERKSYVHVGFTDLDELKFLVPVREK